MSVEKISLESGKLSVFKVHFILSVAKLYYYCCELARRVSLGCKWPHITTRDRLFAILASEKKCIHFACLESFHENKAFKVLKIRGNSNKVKSKYHRFKSHLWISKVRRVRIKIRKFILYLKKIFSNIPNCFLILENSIGFFSTVTNLWYKNSWKEIKRIFKS